MDIFRTLKINDFDLVKKILYSENINLEASDEYDSRIMHYACQYGLVEIVEYLLDKVELVVCNFIKVTPVHLARMYGHDTIVQLLANRVDLEKEDIFRRKPIDYACHFGKIELVRLLVDGL
jgi:ankyrin repeat protein